MTTMEVIWANILLGKASKSAARALRGSDHVILASESLGTQNMPPSPLQPPAITGIAKKGRLPKNGRWCVLWPSTTHLPCPLSSRLDLVPSVCIISHVCIFFT